MLRRPEAKGGTDEVKAAMDTIADAAATAINGWLETTQGRKPEDAWGKTAVSVAVRTAAGRPAVLFDTGEMVVNRPRTEPQDRSAIRQQNSTVTDPMAARAVEVECKLGLLELRRLQAKPGARPIWWDDDEINWAEATTEQDALEANPTRNFFFARIAATSRQTSTTDLGRSDPSRLTLF
jgi:hypothetical protein